MIRNIQTTLKGKKRYVLGALAAVSMGLFGFGKGRPTQQGKPVPNPTQTTCNCVCPIPSPQPTPTTTQGPQPTQYPAPTQQGPRPTQTGQAPGTLKHVCPTKATKGDEVQLVQYNPNSSISPEFACGALNMLNEVYVNGCLHRKWLEAGFQTFHNVEGDQIKTKEEAYQLFVANAPYELDLRWYKSAMGVIGYTYAFEDGIEKLDGESCYQSEHCPSETKIFSNRGIVSTYEPKYRAEHWAHELSHQERAGGYTHYTITKGSTPYTIGDVVLACIEELQASQGQGKGLDDDAQPTVDPASDPDPAGDEEGFVKVDLPKVKKLKLH